MIIRRYVLPDPVGCCQVPHCASSLHWLTIPLFMIIFLSAACQTNSADNHKPSARTPQIVQFRPFGLKSYLLLFDAFGRDLAEDQNFYIWPGDQQPMTLPNSKPYVFDIDQCVAGDSNIIVYSQEAADSTYLIAVRLGSLPVTDTLYAGRIGAADNPMTPDCDLICSMRDSLFLFNDWRNRGRNGEVVWKLLPNRQWKRERILPRLSGFDIAHDFSQMYFCTDSLRSQGYPVGTLLVLDLSADSLYQATEVGSGIIEARRRSRNEPIFLLKKWESDSNIWAYIPGSGARRITDVRPPKEIFTFKFWGDSLECSVIPSQNGVFPDEIFVPLGPDIEK